MKGMQTAERIICCLRSAFFRIRSAIHTWRLKAPPFKMSGKRPESSETSDIHVPTQCKNSGHEDLLISPQHSSFTPPVPGSSLPLAPASHFHTQAKNLSPSRSSGFIDFPLSFIDCSKWTGIECGQLVSNPSPPHPLSDDFYRPLG